MERRLRLVVFQENEERWIARGLEHDIAAEAASEGEAVRALLRIIEAHTAFDIRHDHVPLAAFEAAPRRYWNLYTAGTPISLPELGVAPPREWDITAAHLDSRAIEPDPRYCYASHGFRV